MSSAAPARTHGISATDLFRLHFVDDVALSPDGSQIACTVAQPDGKANRNRSSIWIVPTTGGEARQVTSGEKKDTNPAWSPDGTRLAFVSDRGTKGQLFLLDLASGGEAQRLTTDDDHAASEPIWSPDGNEIAFLCKVPSVPEPVHNVEYEDESDKPKIITRGKYKYDGEGFFDHTRKQLFVIPSGGGEARQLTSGTMPVGQIAWSPDGTTIALAANRSENEDHERRSDVWTVDVASGALTQVTPHDGAYGSPAWSPDGKTLAIVGHTSPAKGGVNDRLWTVPATGGAPKQTTDLDRSIGSGVMSDTGANDRRQPAWVGDDLYFLAAINGTAQIWRVPASGGSTTQVTQGMHAIASWDISRDGATLVYGASTPTNPGEVHTQSLHGGAATRRTQLNADILAERDPSGREEFWLPAGDGTGEQIQGWIVKPPGFDPATKYPLLLEIHGGPAATYGVGWFHEFQYFAAQGYVVVYCNPRGSQGYGENFCTSIYQDWGTKPMMDVMAAVDHVIAQGYIDTDHLYVTGGSYGGYMTDWIVTHTDRFRAAATQRCVSNLMTLALVDDTGTLWLGDYFGGMPWDAPEVYARNSPITHIANCKTPLFIEHEEEDHRCPMDQAEQVYNALHKLGVETELVRYPKEPHGMSRDGGPLHRVDRLQRIIGWFERHK
ncbi:MAG: S9 family peptidase [Chloroflexota bacterium]|nr:S9 family peptidase [Chloroflexota bacterium]